MFKYKIYKNKLNQFMIKILIQIYHLLNRIDASVAPNEIYNNSYIEIGYFSWLVIMNIWKLEI